jgi:hypothetical protein
MENMSRPWMSLVALTLAWSGPVVTTTHGAIPDQDPAGYQEIVGQYRAGDVAAAVRRIVDWDGARLVGAARAFAAQESSRRRDRDGIRAISAACLLHLEALARHYGRPRCEGHHLHVLRAHLARLRDLDRLSPWTADLHVALAVQLQGRLKVEDLRIFFDEVGEMLAFHGRFLLAKGTLHELLASRRLEAARRAVLVPGARTSLDRAERFLGQAVAVAPGLTEARLRLAHVVVRQGRPDDGIALLQPLLQGPLDPDTRYLGSLFLGQAHAAAGRLEPARQAFAAAAPHPCGRAAAMALAHQDFLARRFDAARKLLDGTREASAGCDDPWARYDYGQARELPGLIAELRRAVLP